MSTIYACAAPIRRLGKHQFNMLSFALNNPGWHSVGKGRVTLRILLSLEKKGVIEVARHRSEVQTDWQFKFNQRIHAATVQS